MTVSELIASLSKYPGSTEVLVAQNALGDAALVVNVNHDFLPLLKTGDPA